MSVSSGEYLTGDMLPDQCSINNMSDLISFENEAVIRCVDSTSEYFLST